MLTKSIMDRGRERHAVAYVCHFHHQRVGNGWRGDMRVEEASSVEQARAARVKIVKLAVIFTNRVRHQQPPKTALEKMEGPAFQACKRILDVFNALLHCMLVPACRIQDDRYQARCTCE
eukprot:TRINITY_DN10716_c0_g1_i1.p1 TRINITY_DN10716_c0_g1~~TRINITY_DN10716_c0_g1_i1.p1  ORF type:complete len:119 (-),score=5.52 TRINITY_DN10716_c0_g1_i1:477-833(-)